MADFIYAIKEIVLRPRLDVITETLENYDEAIRKSPKRSEKWNVVRKDPKQLVTSLGTVQYRKTLFINKSTNFLRLPVLKIHSSLILISLEKRCTANGEST